MHWETSQQYSLRLKVCFRTIIHEISYVHGNYCCCKDYSAVCCLSSIDSYISCPFALNTTFLTFGTGKTNLPAPELFLFAFDHITATLQKSDSFI
jgi:hypothetical protein